MFWWTIHLYTVSLWVTCVLFSLSGCCAYLCGPEATGLIRQTFIHAGHCQNPEPLHDSWAMASIQTSVSRFVIRKKSQILTLFHWTNFRGSFCGGCLTVWLLCSTASLPSHGILYLQLSERRESLSCSVPLASLALWTDAITCTVFRMPLCGLIVNIAYNASTSAL